jgi:hypothetical protein
MIKQGEDGMNGESATILTLNGTSGAAPLVSNIVVEVEAGVPLPRSAGRSRYPWTQMTPGDSFLFPDGISIKSARTMASVAGKRLGWRFAVRRMFNGVRVWRVQ